MIRNSRFERCGNTFIGTYLDWGSFSGLVIENNTFFQTTDDTYYGAQLGYKPGYTCAGLVFRNNSYDPNARRAAYPPGAAADRQLRRHGHRLHHPGATRTPSALAPGPDDCAGNWHDNVFETLGTGCGTGVTYRPR